ncbi:MAG: hypothetical protein A3C79_03100 [Candidatus Taylorbacteria bacterium RIFCSPHIGHO2_02_FULL_45_28]|nr:MAG: hypothetical protein A3C79_03100 [Candidatus Taylorbacteria bacterium RIFCSPHIGHO2_02_FULL_45_28]
MKTSACLLTAMFLGAIGIQSAEKPDDSLAFQLRIPIHLQFTGLHTNSLGSFGIAAWTIFSDVTEEDNNTANFNVIGSLWQYGERGSWLEVMGGYKRTEDGFNDPALDIRLFDRTVPKVNIAAEIAYFPREERRRLYTWLAMDIPISLRKYQARIGLESENIVSCSGRRDSLGIGPRLVLPLPFVSKISPALSSSLTTTYQYRNDRDFVRCYLGLTYKFGKK